MDKWKPGVGGCCKVCSKPKAIEYIVVKSGREAYCYAVLKEGQVSWTKSRDKATKLSAEEASEIRDLYAAQVWRA